MCRQVSTITLALSSVSWGRISTEWAAVPATSASAVALTVMLSFSVFSLPPDGLHFLAKSYKGPRRELRATERVIRSAHEHPQPSVARKAPIS